MAHFKSSAITATYFEVKYSTCVCSPVRITLWINAVDFFHTFSALDVSYLTVGLYSIVIDRCASYCRACAVKYMLSDVCV